MDEIQSVKQSHPAYHSHIMRTLKKIDKILEKDNPLSDTDIAKLTSHMERLTQKKETLQQLNSQIAAALQTDTDLQTDILESEEIQDTIMEYISIVKQHVQSSCLSIHSLDAAAPVFTPTPPTKDQ